MEMKMPDGGMLRESFDTTEAMFKRFGELSAKGGKLQKMHIPNDDVPADQVLRRKRQLQRMLGRP